MSIFVPRLPLGLPRRDFGVFSWIAAIEGNGCGVRVDHKGINVGMVGDSIVNLPVEVGRYERLEDLERKAKDAPVKYATPGEMA